MKDNKSGWQFPKALEIIKCKEFVPSTRAQKTCSPECRKIQKRVWVREHRKKEASERDIVSKAKNKSALVELNRIAREQKTSYGKIKAAEYIKKIARVEV